MKSWISEYVATARNFRRFGKKVDAKRYMARAKGLKAYLIATGKYEDQTNAGKQTNHF